VNSTDRKAIGEAGASEHHSARARRLWRDAAERHVSGTGKRGRKILSLKIGQQCAPAAVTACAFSYAALVPKIAPTAEAVRGGGGSGRSRRCRDSWNRRGSGR